VGEEYDIEIMEMGSRGDGVTRIKNFVVFVNGAKVGEKIRIKITDIRGRFAVAEKIGEQSGEATPAEEAAAEEPAAEEAAPEAEPAEAAEEVEAAAEEVTEDAPVEEAAPSEEAAAEEPDAE
jgi:predicted RNA-binding protein with TRAM domain